MRAAAVSQQLSAEERANVEPIDIAAAALSHRLDRASTFMAGLAAAMPSPLIQLPRCYRRPTARPSEDQSGNRIAVD